MGTTPATEPPANPQGQLAQGMGAVALKFFSAPSNEESFVWCFWSKRGGSTFVDETPTLKTAKPLSSLTDLHL